MLRKLQLTKGMQTELFSINKDNPFEKIENDLIKIIQDNPTPTILKLENKIQKLEDDNELKKIELQDENTKQQEIKAKRDIEHKRFQFNELLLQI